MKKNWVKKPKSYFFTNDIFLYIDLIKLKINEYCNRRFKEDHCFINCSNRFKLWRKSFEKLNIFGSLNSWLFPQKNFVLRRNYCKATQKSMPLRYLLLAFGLEIPRRATSNYFWAHTKTIFPSRPPNSQKWNIHSWIVYSNQNWLYDPFINCLWVFRQGCQ